MKHKGTKNRINLSRLINLIFVCLKNGFFIQKNIYYEISSFYVSMGMRLPAFRPFEDVVFHCKKNSFKIKFNLKKELNSDYPKLFNEYNVILAFLRNKNLFINYKNDDLTRLCLLESKHHGLQDLESPASLVNLVYDIKKKF